MIGVTNSWNNKPRLTIDNNTMFLMTDTVEDKSQYQSEIINTNVTVNTSTKRDGRNSLLFKNGISWLQINKYDFITGDKDYTIEWWANHTASTNVNGNGCIFNASSQQAAWYYGILLGHNWMYPERTWYYTSQGYVINDKYNSTGLFDHGTSTWYHYACVRSNQFTWSVYLNGNLRWSMTLSGNTVVTIPTMAAGALIGAYWAGTNTRNINNRCDFYLQDFRISSCARYTRSFTPPTRFI